MPSTVIFGDVHGSAWQLKELITQARRRFGSDVEFYSLGDLVDRGPDSKGVLDICVAEGVKGILGNHELWLCSVLSGHAMNDMPYSKIMGGLTTLASYGLSRGDPDNVGPAIRRTIPKAHQEWLLALPPYRFIEVAGVVYALVHTGINAGTLTQIRAQVPEFPERSIPQLLVEQAPDMFFWTGPNPKSPEKVAKFESFVQVFGHTPNGKALEVPGHFIALDTGCGTCPPFSLAAVVLHEDGKKDFISVH